MVTRTIRIAVCVCLLASCGDDGQAAATDAAFASDAVATDAITINDAPTDAAAFPLAGFGDLSGDCDVLDDELTDNQPSLVASVIAFGQGYVDANLGQLTPGGQQIVADDNAGGSSLLSEVFAFELLQRCERATLLKTETQIVYDTTGKITDLLVDVDGIKLGVSVTRAVGFPFDDPYTVQQAQALLTGKLDDILLSSANVAAVDRWQKQILVVVAYAPEHVTALMTALATVAASTRADTIVWLLASNGDDEFLYCDGACP